ncbi:PREDICTED: transmembrane protein 138-like [Priapulus caudatus]|uniref:Transmembrane protein 138 n=1 Tax=Priapulus caudatus TaxID=37621 RepID=A0ABM1F4X0_PRICU|nr:PREDICTED: transmembrane protein 138-like [Priapulus caudatus]
MNISRYRPILYLQCLFLGVDLFVNAFSELLRIANVVLLVMFVIQDMCLIFAIIVTFLMFFTTYVFQAGLIHVLIRKFKTTIITAFIYLGLSISLHIWTMTLRWTDTNTYIWTAGYHTLYIIQRTGAAFHYYFYKRTSLKLSDPKFYEESDWIKSEFAKQR